MRIELVSGMPTARKPRLLCRFTEAGTKYTLQPAAGFGSKHERQLTLAGQESTLFLTVNIDSFKHYERAEARRVAAASTMRQLQSAATNELVWLLDGNVELPIFTQLVTGALLFAYRFDRYKALADAPRKPAEPKLVVIAGSNLAKFRRELARLKKIDAGISQARDLANLPPNDLTPEVLAEQAKQMAAECGMAFSLLNAKQLAAGNYNGITAVGQGSTHPPVMFTIKYKPATQLNGLPGLCLVGKGLTFDSGGLSIKPWEGMWDMKADMGGAAAVIGAMRAIAELQLPIQVVAVVGAAENMPDGRAYRPGDILRYKNGKSVEIHSTDAEGRLVLADALLYAQETLQQKRIVEFSTLTGACVRALGHQYIGLMSRSTALAEAVSQAAAISGESVWELPLHPEYRALLDSSVADFKNVGGPLAGAQTAGWFLHEFIADDTEYVHLDIAGVFLAEKESKYWSQAGATGGGVRLTVALAELLSA